jgi:hypothetical protein
VGQCSMMGIAVTAVRAAVMSVKNAITHVRQIIIRVCRSVAF